MEPRGGKRWQPVASPKRPKTAETRGNRCRALREGCHYSCRVSGGCSVVLVDEAAEPVATADLALKRSFTLLIEFGRPQFARAMRPLTVVVVDVNAQDALKLSSPCDQEPVEAVATDGADPAFGEGVRVGCPIRVRMI